MARRLSIAGAQLGPIGRGEPRAKVVRRLIALMEEAKGRGAELVVFPELALTTFFPRWHITDAAELESYYESEMPSAATLPLFEEAKRLGIAFHLGYAERVIEEGANDASTRRSWSTAAAPSSPNTARSICRAMPSPTRPVSSSIWRSAISSPEISASRPGMRWAACWAY